MAVLNVTTRGQVTFRKEFLNHMGIEPGEKVEVEKLPNGQILLRQVRRKTGTINDFIGLLAGKTDKVLTIEEINQATQDAWAGKR